MVTLNHRCHFGSQPKPSNPFRTQLRSQPIGLLPPSFAPKVESYLDAWWQAQGLEADLKPRVNVLRGEGPFIAAYQYEDHELTYHPQVIPAMAEADIRHVVAHEAAHARQWLLMTALWQQAPQRAEAVVLNVIKDSIAQPDRGLLLSNERSVLMPSGEHLFAPFWIDAPQLSKTSQRKFTDYFLRLLKALNQDPRFQAPADKMFCILQNFDRKHSRELHALARQMPELGEQYINSQRATEALENYTEALLIQYQLLKTGSQIPPEHRPVLPARWLTPARQAEAENCLKDVAQTFLANRCLEYRDPRRALHYLPEIAQHYAVLNYPEFNAREMAVRHSSQHDPEQEPIWQTGQHMLKLARQLACLQKQLDGQPKHLPTLKKRDEALQQWEAHHRPLLFMAPQYAESAQTLREAIEEREQEAAQLRQELNQLSAVIPTVSPLLPESVQKQRLQGRTLEEAQMAFLESARAYQETQANLAYYQELQRTFLAVPKLSQEIEGTYRPEALYHPLSEETRALLSAYEHCLAEFDEQALKTKGFIYFPDCAQFRRAQRQRHP